MVVKWFLNGFKVEKPNRKMWILPGLCRRKHFQKCKKVRSTFPLASWTVYQIFFRRHNLRNTILPAGYQYVPHSAIKGCSLRSCTGLFMCCCNQGWTENNFFLVLYIYFLEYTLEFKHNLFFSILIFELHSVCNWHSLNYNVEYYNLIIRCLMMHMI
jgi:hypothetical protein